MKGDDRIWAECLGGHPDWREVGNALGVAPDDAMRRAMSIGAWWLRGISPEDASRAEAAMAEGRGPDDVARALGTDVHGALIWVGMRTLYRRN